MPPLAAARCPFPLSFLPDAGAAGELTKCYVTTTGVYSLILTRFVVHRRPMTTRSRAFPTFLFAGSDAYCKRFQALLSILLTLLPAIPQLHVRVGAVGKFTHEKYGRPPRVIRFRCFVRFAGSLPPRACTPFPLPLLPPASAAPRRRLSPPVVSLHIHPIYSTLIIHLSV